MPDGTADTTRIDPAAGLDLLKGLDAVAEADASGDLKETYEDLMATLRVPYVDDLFTCLGATSPFLVRAWRAVAPLVGTVAFEERADRLRADVVKRIDAPPGLEAGLSDDQEVRLRAVLDTHHYAYPKLVLVAELLARVADEGTQGRTDLSKTPTPRGPERDMAAPRAAPQNDGMVQNTYKDIKRRHDLPIVPGLYRSLAEWPLFLQAAWGTIVPAMEADTYLDTRRSIQHEAEEWAGDLRIDAAAAKAARADAGDLDAARDVLAAFRYRILPDATQEILRIKVGLDGQKGAAHSRFSATRRH